MTCWTREEYTIYDHKWEFGIKKWNHEWKYFKDRVIELTDCEARFFNWIDSDCREMQVTVAKQISKLFS
jgi:hypothetical protein